VLIRPIEAETQHKALKRFASDPVEDAGESVSDLLTAAERDD
jgi:hypothetical protein